MKTTNDNLLEQIDYLISEVLVIKEILIPRIKKPEEVPKYLSAEEAIALSLEKKIPMSFSKLYKLTATNGIPFNKVGNKLIFCNEELEQWLNDQIIKKEIGCPSSNLSIIKSDQNKN